MTRAVSPASRGATSATAERGKTRKAPSGGSRGRKKAADSAKAERKPGVGARQAKKAAKPARGTAARPTSLTVAKEARSSRRRSPQNAQSMAARQREISVSEFFTKNRHLLGFDNPQKALLTTVKEAVDNALDACEEASILPEILVEIEATAENRFRVVVEDNGPGIVKAQIPNIFGKLLYGSKFHQLKQSRGQQGIGISAAGMYGSLTTGKPVAITSRIGPRKPAHHYKLQIDARKNDPHVIKDQEVEWDKASGTRVEIELEGIYKRGRRSVDEYIEQTALSNPHATLIYRSPGAEEMRFDRVVGELPREPIAIKPHPHGVELGALIKMLRETRARNLAGALQIDFSRVSASVAQEILNAAGLRAEAHPKRMSTADIEKLFKAIPGVKIMAPPSSCLSPIGEEQLLAGLSKHLPADFHTAVTRGPQVYRGMPFQVEVGLAYGGALPADELIEVRRFANRVPLCYQQSACAITKAVLKTEWRNYQLSQSRGALPTAPMLLFVHIASVWVPFTSESKEAIAHYPEILREVRLGLQEAGRRLGVWLRRRKRAEAEGKKRDYIRKYIPHLVVGLQQILGFDDKERDRTVDELQDYLERTRKQVVVS